ncbi:Conserved hypothetical protein [Geobacillus thermodenitrificans NG80-2]|uniref:Uncharacterized protein n=1 Tax=Geobacillus thermodenitrificans (strain NG80-2) TaxID=420246 RepID=A4IK13_GEOTN|nr:hypothetical protein [Geobacillus thermodenitrificans]ABO65667.1 Conserved hypothetical protein [Geobacillus thermodenitrificans NG80-2]
MSILKKLRALALLALIVLAGVSLFHVLTPHEVIVYRRLSVPFDGMHGGLGHHHLIFRVEPRAGWLIPGLLMWFIPLLLVGVGAIWLVAKRSKRWIGWALITLGIAALLPKWVLLGLALAAVYTFGRHQTRKSVAAETWKPTTAPISTDWLDEWEKIVQKEGKTNGCVPPDQNNRSR